MARGIPVIASDRTSLPEVVGEAGLLFDPDRPTELADAIVEVIGNPTHRADLINAGRARANELTWDEAAQSFITLFRKVVSPYAQCVARG